MDGVDISTKSGLSKDKRLGEAAGASAETWPGGVGKAKSDSTVASATAAPGGLAVELAKRHLSIAVLAMAGSFSASFSLLPNAKGALSPS